MCSSDLSAEIILNKNKSKNKKIIKLKHIKIIDADSFIPWSRLHGSRGGARSTRTCRHGSCSNGFDFGHQTDKFSLYDDSIDMVVSVSISHAPSVLCKENQSGFVELMLNPTAGRRQNIPVYYEYNGAIYIINPKSLREKGISNFEKKIKYIMPKHRSIDIDDQYDFMYAETILAYER